MLPGCQIEHFRVTAMAMLTRTNISARDLTLEAARDASALKRPSRDSVSTAQIKKLLDSRSEREVLEGLRRVIAVLFPRPHTI